MYISSMTERMSEEFQDSQFSFVKVSHWLSANARRSLLAFFLPQRRAGRSMFECLRDHLSRIAPWLPADLCSLHLARYVCFVTHSVRSVVVSVNGYDSHVCIENV